MEWWMFFVIFWAVFGCGAGCRRAVRGFGTQRRVRAGGSGRERMISARTRGSIVDPAGRGTGAVEAAPSVPPPPTRESPLEALQREFVEGTITMDEYERRLERMDPRTIP